ncbi:hypothetical protein F4818DRAFT_441269 [Hypoxylon cercidicola]|nr:hypothetical protein F4818DRAFT_441269 [Hypoxylon cercidicola]
MSCKHLLTHYTQRCEKGRDKPCARPSLEGPRVYLPDCCAACDPEFNVNKIKREQRNKHAKLVEQVYANQRSGSSEEVSRLLERIHVLTTSTNKATGEAKHSHTSAIDVEFPGVTEPKGTSKWIDGKCVWEEEEQWSLPPYRAEIRRSNQTTSTQVVEETLGTRVPPRLRSTKKGYIGPREEPHREQFEITGPPRLRTNKPYSGPRGRVAVIESPEPERAPEMQHRLRRTKKHAEGLGRHDITPIDTKRHGDNSPDIDRTPRPLKQNYVVVKGEEMVDEDIWLQLAEMDTKGKASRKIKARMTE